MSRFATVAIWLVWMTYPDVVLAVSSTSPPILEPGHLRAIAAAGPAIMDRDVNVGLELSFEAGLASRLELAAPFALGLNLIDVWPGSAIYVGVGVVDLWVTREGRVLFSPSVALAGHARIGPETALRAAVDFTGVEEGFAKGDHPFWIRGSLAVIIDMGPWATLGMGFAYQRLAIGDEPPKGTEKTGWVSDSRFSFGAVRAQPFYDLPTLSIHLTDYLDIVLIARVDIDANTRTTDSRWLFGLELKKNR
ncbi:MAG: hypothetical protein GY847_31600 [Proteobacteria bacterium]|nr:hypothetical protein [Pseudomonadota bacterium]